MEFTGPFQEYPNLDLLEEKFLQSFQDLINLGSETWRIEILGNYFTFGRLKEWEEREVFRKTVNTDPITRSKLLKVEILEKAIISVQTATGQEYSFLDAKDKIRLRSILLSLSPEVIDYLYSAYEWGAEQIRAMIQEKLPKIEEVLDKDFFVSSGLSAKGSESTTSEVKNSENSLQTGSDSTG